MQGSPEVRPNDHSQTRGMTSVKIRSILLVAMAFACLVAVSPASAQNLAEDPYQDLAAQQQAAAGGGGGGSSDSAAGVATTTTSGSGSLPFTGFEAAFAALLGVGLIAVGFTVRRAARAGRADA
jgi:hypothetical protein